MHFSQYPSIQYPPDPPLPLLSEVQGLSKLSPGIRAKNENARFRAGVAVMAGADGLPATASLEACELTMGITKE